MRNTCVNAPGFTFQTYATDHSIGSDFLENKVGVPGVLGGCCQNGATTLNDYRACTEEPTPEPTGEPTPTPVNVPTSEPTPQPSPAPTTPAPTADPTPAPSPAPTTEEPTKEPTGRPTAEPTTKDPTTAPTKMPTESPKPPTCYGQTDHEYNLENVPGYSDLPANQTCLSAWDSYVQFMQKEEDVLFVALSYNLVCPGCSALCCELKKIVDQSGNYTGNIGGANIDKLKATNVDDVCTCPVRTECPDRIADDGSFAAKGKYGDFTCTKTIPADVTSEQLVSKCNAVVDGVEVWRRCPAMCGRCPNPTRYPEKIDQCFNAARELFSDAVLSHSDLLPVFPSDVDFVGDLSQTDRSFLVSAGTVDDGSENVRDVLPLTRSMVYGLCDAD